jgi:hypothetical protein
VITLTSSGGTISLSTGGVDAAGVRWKAPAPPEGWHGAPPRLVSEPRTGANGVVIAQHQRDAWALVLRGSAVAATEAKSWDARASVEAICHGMIGADGTLTVVEPRVPPVTKSLTVRLASQPRLEHVSPLMFRFEIDLLAATAVKTVA